MAFFPPEFSGPSATGVRLTVHTIGSQPTRIPVTGRNAEVSGFAVLPQEATTQDQADELSAKLQVFYDALTPSEQHIMAAVLAQAADYADPTGSSPGTRPPAMT